MSGYKPVSVDEFIRQYIRNNKGADANAVRKGIEEALAAWRQGVRCACGKPLWVAGSAVAGYGCFSCITGSAEPDDDPELIDVCDRYLVDVEPDPFEQVSEIMKNHPQDYRERLEEIGFIWQDDEYDLLYEEETKEERLAVPQTENQRQLVHFLDNGGIVDQPVLDVYLNERYAETPNLPLIRKYFKQANPNLKSILLVGLGLNPTDVDLLDDLAYFSEFDSMLGELIHFYTDACKKETDMERFSQLVQDFHMNTCEQGYDALHELTTIFRSGDKGAVIQHLHETILPTADLDDMPF